RRRAIQIPSGYHGPRSRPTCCGPRRRSGGLVDQGRADSTGGGSPPMGSTNRKAAPPSGRLSAQMRPPCASMMAPQIATPNPPPRPASLRARTSIELLEDAILLARGEPGPAVSHLDDGVAILGPGVHVDLRARRRVLGRVLQQVDEHLLDQCVVHGDQREIL